MQGDSWYRLKNKLFMQQLYGVNPFVNSLHHRTYLRYVLLKKMMKRNYNICKREYECQGKKIMEKSKKREIWK